ncbi:hypothetical protein [Luteolibacter sp. LG18]|uniref:hypothetical protein n=1 Tax=Luteolibacter sp. LG18 TaxID=2819286 RepID=UPI002B2BC2B2|nr:hypothetical protein llg_26190 [Luteolibacter sp. LG18]
MLCKPTRFSTCAALVLLAARTALAAEPVPSSVPADLPDFRWHLTARPWQPVKAADKDLLDQMEKAMLAMAPMQHWNANDAADKMNGAILDPIDKKEIQYGTPLFAFNAATLLSRGRAASLAEPAARALDRASLNISTGKANDGHGEFFIAPMVKAVRLLEKLSPRPPEISEARLAAWKKALTTPRASFMNLTVKQNWRTFAMKGEWLRQQDGYITDAVKWNEANWLVAAEGGQRERFRRDLDKHGLKPNFFLYHDDTADPETFAYNGATTANLLDGLESGYDGSSAAEMRAIIAHNLKSSLLMLSGSGEAPGGGRTGEHIWDDTIYANSFQLMSEAALREGDARLAGQYRHAVELLLKSHARFQQENGWFSITKNRFPAALKNRYATWSGVANYLGFTLACCSETLGAKKTEITEQPIPSEIGGYVMTLDPSFANVFLNAGGMQAQICTRGETDKYGGVQWHTLGITRISRTGWDGRLGPGAGHVNPDFSDGLSFSPVFEEGGKWTRVCLEPKRFTGRFQAEFVHPLLTRGTFTIAPMAGAQGPTFTMNVTLTPDGALVDTASWGKEKFGVVCPLLEFDGRTVLETSVANGIATTRYPLANGEPLQVSAPATRAPEGPIEWAGVKSAKAGPTTIGFSYALPVKGVTKKMRLKVNGKPLPDLAFIATGEGPSHQLLVPATLAAGANTIRLEPIDADGPKIDQLRVYPVSPAPENDQQAFIALKPGHRFDTTAPAVRGGYGDFRPAVLADAQGGTVETFVYPRSAGDPTAAEVRASFKRKGADFTSVLGRVTGTLYTGRTSAGGEGKAIDLDRDGKDDVTFSETCAFILQLKDGKVTALEADRPVTATLGGKTVKVEAWQPVGM